MKARVALVIAAALIPSTAVACLWDYDTIRMERERFPSTLELITGKFLRHSKEFYEWRIADRQAKLAADPDNLAYLDDLAVAYDKVGDQAKAIETIRRKDRVKPLLYETEANLGTFLIHAGRLEEGLVHIDNALAINPKAHFNREKYQKALVEYVISRRVEGKTRLPLCWDGRTPEPGTVPRGGEFTLTFASFLSSQARPATPEKQADAIKGVLGIMKFGNYDSPIVLEALGSLLTLDYGANPEQDAKQLGARAFLKATYEAKDEDAKAGYRKLAEQALVLQTRGPGRTDQLPLTEVEAEFQKELAEARAWYEELRQNELRWIREGKNPEEEFARVYYTEPEITPSDSPPGGPEVFHRRLYLVLGIFLTVVLVSTALAGWLLWWSVRRIRARWKPPIPDAAAKCDPAKAES